MKLILGQLLVILAPFLENEIFGTVKMIKDDRIMLNIKGAMKLTKFNEILCISITDDGVFEFYSKVEDIVNNTIFITKPSQENLSVIEQRKFNRMDCEIGLVGRLARYHNKPLIGIGKQFSGTIKNISAGGILLETNLSLPVDMVINFKLKLQYFLDCNAIVKRVSKVEGPSVFQLGCQFVDMQIDDMKTISLFIFKEQLKAKQKQFKNDLLTQ